MKFFLIAGEMSGDILGAAIIDGLKAEFPDAQFIGVTGENMERAGCRSVGSIETLSVMGLVEVLQVLPKLFRFRAELLREIERHSPDCVIGIDAPDFNLGLEKRVRTSGISTVHVVSPSVWAWRSGRIKGIKKAVDLMLCLLPFETEIYNLNSIKAEFIGHPLADQLDVAYDKVEAKSAIPTIEPKESVVALMPGSRSAEVKQLLPIFLQTADLLRKSYPALQFVIPVAKPSLKRMIEQDYGSQIQSLGVKLLDGKSRDAMRAADVVLLASGTATLECLLLGVPMVVAYKVSPVTNFLLRKVGLLKIDKISLPNLLSDQASVPELLQSDANPQRCFSEVQRLLEDDLARQNQIDSFNAVRQTLMQSSGTRAAKAIRQLLS